MFLPPHLNPDELIQNTKKILDVLMKNYSEDQPSEEIEFSSIRTVFNEYLTASINERIAEGS